MAAPESFERDKDLVSFGAVAGVRNDVAAERLNPNDLALAENVKIDRTGAVSLREGQTRLSAAATHSVWSDREQIALCVQGTTLKSIGADFTVGATLMAGLTAGQPMRYAKGDGLVYFANGQQKGVLQNGVVRSWGLPVPSAPAVVVGGGQMPAGTYQYAVTWLRDDGQESGAGLAGMITVSANAALTFVRPTAPNDATVVGWNVYLTAPNGEVLYLALPNVPLSSTAVYAGGTLELTADLMTQFLQEPPIGHLVAYANGRAYVAVDDAIFYSEPYSPELFDLRHYWPLDGRVTMMAPADAGQGGGAFFVGTTSSCGVIEGDDPETAKYVAKTDYGAIEGALDYVDGTLLGDGAAGAVQVPLWLSEQGICVGVGTEIRNLTRGHYTFTAAGLGAAVFRASPNRFIAVSNF